MADSQSLPLGHRGTLDLPLTWITDKTAYLGRTGSGKSYAAMRAAELMLLAGAQIVALDPVGVWYGLRIPRESSGGRGFDVVVFGGLHGDLPLEPSAGALIADTIVGRRLSAVLDLSQIEHDTDRTRFATAFVKRFFYLKTTKRTAVHVFLEEAQEFVPEDPQKGEQTMLHDFNRMWKLGRNFGIGGSIITQRPQEVSKKALNLSGCMFAFQMTGPHERKTIKSWVADKGQDLDIVDALPKLDVGHAHVWYPDEAISREVHTSTKLSADVSSTPEVGAETVETRPLKPVDIERLKKALAESIERVKADDPVELRRQVATLKAELAKKPVAAAPPAPAPKIVEKPILTDAHVKRLEHAIDKLGKADPARWLEALQQASTNLRMVATDITTALRAATARPAPSPSPAASAPPRRVDARPQQRPEHSKTANDSALPRGECAILTAAAQHEAGVTRPQLTVLTGYKRSTRDRYILYLQEKGFVRVEGERVFANESGIAQLGDAFEPLPTGDALRDHWLRTLPAGEAAILRVVINAYPNAVARDRITEETEYQRSTRDRYILYLVARALITTDRDGVRASNTLFDAAAA